MLVQKSEKMVEEKETLNQKQKGSSAKKAKRSTKSKKLKLEQSSRRITGGE